MQVSVRRGSQVHHFLLAVSCIGYCTLHDSCIDESIRGNSRNKKHLKMNYFEDMN